MKRLKKIEELGNFVKFEEESVKKEETKGARKKENSKTHKREYYTLNLNIATINLRSLLQHELMNLIYLMDHILFQTFKIILNISLKT